MLTVLVPFLYSDRWLSLSSYSVRPSVDTISGIFWKKILAQFISYLASTLWGEFLDPYFFFVFLTSLLALWWPNIWPKMGFPERFEKIICPIEFIPGIYPYGVSLLTHIHFRVHSLIFGFGGYFLDKVGSDQSGGILSPFTGTACSSLFLYTELHVEITQMFLFSVQRSRKIRLYACFQAYPADAALQTMGLRGGKHYHPLGDCDHVIPIIGIP